MPELWEIGLDPAVQGVPVKKKRSVLSFNTGKGEVDNRGLMLRAYY